MTGYRSVRGARPGGCFVVRSRQQPGDPGLPRRSARRPQRAKLVERKTWAARRRQQPGGQVVGPALPGRSTGGTASSRCAARGRGAAPSRAWPCAGDLTPAFSPRSPMGAPGRGPASRGCSRGLRGCVVITTRGAQTRMPTTGGAVEPGTSAVVRRRQTIRSCGQPTVARTIEYADAGTVSGPRRKTRLSPTRSAADRPGLAKVCADAKGVTRSIASGPVSGVSTGLDLGCLPEAA